MLEVDEFSDLLEICKISQVTGGPQGLSAVGIGRYLRTANPEVIIALVNEIRSLRKESVRKSMRIKELDLLFGRYILAMRSALIEEEHGKGAAAAMEWIYNSLVGPGELPPEGETDSQAYFDREIVAVDKGMEEVMAFHHPELMQRSKPVTPA